MRLLRTMMLMLAFVPMLAHASLIGDSVVCDGNGLLRCALPGQSSNGDPWDLTNTVGGGVEFGINNNNEAAIFEIDVAGVAVVLVHFRAGRDDLVDADVPGEGADDLLGARGDDEDA